MSKLQLPDVTLLMIETRCHELAKLALEETLNKIEPKDVIIFTDKPPEINIPGAYYVWVEDWPDKVGWARCFWHKAPSYVLTSHAILIQWDSWVFDPAMWSPKFLEYDYIGAPWWYCDDCNVGNSGFNLRSRSLMQYLQGNVDAYPVVTAAEDALLSRTYRPALQKQGFRWADDETALDFSFECVRRSKESRHFGFHAFRNWPAVLDPAALDERIAIARKNRYIEQSDMLTQLGMGPPYYIDGYTPEGKWKLGLG